MNNMEFWHQLRDGLRQRHGIEVWDKGHIYSVIAPCVVAEPNAFILLTTFRWFIDNWQVPMDDKVDVFADMATMPYTDWCAKYPRLHDAIENYDVVLTDKGLADES